ncbi:hypothetical protein Tco_0059580 [Tanacetum coccineum]
MLCPLKLEVKYLGIPLREKNQVYDCKQLVDKVMNKVNDWKNKSLSYAGRLQLIAYCHEPNSEGSGSAWKAYMNVRVDGLFLLVLLEYLNGKGVDETSEPLLYAGRMAGPYRCKDTTRGRNNDFVTSGIRASRYTLDLKSPERVMDQSKMECSRCTLGPKELKVEFVHELVVRECHKPNSEGCSAWKAYINVRVDGLFLLVLLEYLNETIVREMEKVLKGWKIVCSPKNEGGLGLRKLGHGELLNDELLNGELLNGELLNGELLNGELLNGELLNGELLNGELLNGELLNGELLITALTKLGSELLQNHGGLPSKILVASWPVRQRFAQSIGGSLVDFKAAV